MRRLIHFEHRCDAVAPRGRFLGRLARNTLAALAVIAVSLGIGMVGYHTTEKMAWIDAFTNAAMILSGMGPLSPLQSFGGKLFAGLYALFSGLVLIFSTGILLAPIIHRVLHRFHCEHKG
jgi:hypothetical protein